MASTSNRRRHLHPPIHRQRNKLDILYDLFCQIPLAELLPLRAVCTVWRDLIDCVGRSRRQLRLFGSQEICRRYYLKPLYWRIDAQLEIRFECTAMNTLILNSGKGNRRSKTPPTTRDLTTGATFLTRLFPKITQLTLVLDPAEFTTKRYIFNALIALERWSASLQSLVLHTDVFVVAHLEPLMWSAIGQMRSLKHLHLLPGERPMICPHSLPNIGQLETLSIGDGPHSGLVALIRRATALRKLHLQVNWSIVEEQEALIFPESLVSLSVNIEIDTGGRGGLWLFEGFHSLTMLTHFDVGHPDICLFVPAHTLLHHLATLPALRSLILSDHLLVNSVNATPLLSVIQITLVYVRFLPLSIGQLLVPLIPNLRRVTIVGKRIDDQALQRDLRRDIITSYRRTVLVKYREVPLMKEMKRRICPVWKVEK